jgi:osmoprotectant transport system permease protein
LGSFFEFIISKKEQIVSLLLQHISLTATAILIAIMVGVPLGIIISRVPFLRKPIIGFVNLIQAVPSMALLGLLIPLLGIGSIPAIFMVIIYSLLPIVKNTYTGITNIDPVVLESAKGIGLTNNQTLFKIQLPLALPIIMAGVRISAVTAVGLMTLAAFIGAGGLGYLVFSGVQSVNNNMILAGAIPACILALVVDFIFGKIETIVTPRGLNPKAKRKNNKTFKIIGSIVLIAILIPVFSSIFSGKKNKIVIGAKNFTEQLILGNMYADLVEAKTDYKVERKLNLGGSIVAFNALRSGELDMYVDYTGTILMDIMNEQIINDEKKAYDYVKDAMDKKYNLTLLDPIGFNDTYTLAMMPEVANKYGINNISDLAKKSRELILSSTLDFENRDDGLQGLAKSYNLEFKNVKGMDGSIRYSALKNNDAQVIDAGSTDGLLKKFNLKVLEDDKHVFPPYSAAPLVNKDTLEKYPELKETFNSLSEKINEETMINLNYEVDVLLKSPESVARDFLIKENLIK